MANTRLAKQVLARLLTRAAGALIADPTPHAPAVASQGGFSAVARLVGVCEGEAAASLLRLYGAKVGARAMIRPGLAILNAEHDFANLAIGDGCHVGQDVLLDLVDRIEIADRVTVAMRSMLLTHANTGESRAAVPTKRGPIRLAEDVYIGAGAIILPGVSIAAGAIIAAGAVVTRDVAAREVVAGVPATAIMRRD